MRRETLRKDLQMCKMYKLRSCGVAGRSGTLCLRVVVELPHWLQNFVWFGSSCFSHTSAEKKNICTSLTTLM